MDEHTRTILAMDGIRVPENNKKPVIKVDILKAALTGAAGVEVVIEDSAAERKREADLKLSKIIDSAVPLVNDLAVKYCDFTEQLSPSNAKCNTVRQTIASREKK